MWGGAARVLRPAPWPGGNGKVAGVVTGVVAARHERVIIADDDVRYRPDQVLAMSGLLAGCDLVRRGAAARRRPIPRRPDAPRGAHRRCPAATTRVRRDRRDQRIRH
jgi:hypothetical protein